MEAKAIIAESANSRNNNVWVVYISGQEQDKMYCKSAYKAMRFAFLLKKRTGVNISENCLTRLQQEIRKQKEAQAAEVKEKVEEVAKALDISKEAKPKARRQKKATAKTVSISK